MMVIQRKQIINKYLQKIPDLWMPDWRKVNLKSFESIVNFLLKYKKNIKKTDLEALDVAYNRSLMHFFLYYSYYPKISFVFCRDDVIIFGCFDGKKYDKLTLSFAFFQIMNLLWKN